MTLIGIFLLRIIITYDVICQWSKNFRKCMTEFPKHMQIPDTTQVNVAIPGWHINGHGAKCWNNFNLAYMEGTGRTVGENIEMKWAGTNLLALSIQEMAPVARHDTLNDHWNGWNFHKIVGFRVFVQLSQCLLSLISNFDRNIIPKTLQLCIQDERKTDRSV